MTLEEKDKVNILNTYAKKYINFKKGDNAILYDDKNKNYIDFASGIGVVSVGHGNKIVANDIFKQVSNITHTSNLYSIESQILLASKINKLSSYDMSMFFANSGAEANEGAIKIARKYGMVNFSNKKYKIVTFNNSFHGRTITTVKASGQNKMHTNNFSPYPDGFSHLDNFEDLYNNLDDQTVGVMIELIQGEGGVEPYDKNSIKKLASFCKEKSLLLIIDEVQTGAYRTGEFLASNLYEIEPDIITMAKGVGGGVPIGIVMTKHKNIFEPGDHGSTFGGNYLSTSASLSVLNILEDLKNSNTLDETIKYFSNKLNNFYNNNKNVFSKEVGFGLMRGLRVKEEVVLNKFYDESIRNGLLILKAGRNTLRFLPPLTITNKEIDEGFKRLEKSVLNA